MRDRLIALVIAGGVALGAAARMSGDMLLGGRQSSRSPGARVVATGAGCAAGRQMMPRSRIPGMGLVLVAPHPSPAPCQYLALDGTDHVSRHGRGSMIRQPVICRPQPRSAPTATPHPGLGWRQRMLPRRNQKLPIPRPRPRASMWLVERIGWAAVWIPDRRLRCFGLFLTQTYDAKLPQGNGLPSDGLCVMERLYRSRVLDETWPGAGRI